MQEEDAPDPPFDLLMLVPDQKCDHPDYRGPVQRGHCLELEAFYPDNKVILSEPIGWCVVIERIYASSGGLLEGSTAKADD